MECLNLALTYALDLTYIYSSVELNATRLVEHEELKLSHKKLLSNVELDRILLNQSMEECELKRIANEELMGEVAALQSEKLLLEQKLTREVVVSQSENQKLVVEVTALQREKMFLECEKRGLYDKVQQLESTLREVHEEHNEQLSSLQALVACKEKEVDALLLECQADKDAVRSCQADRDDLRGSVMDLRSKLDRSRCEVMQLQVENTRLTDKLIKTNVSVKLALDLCSAGRGGDWKLVDARYAIAQTHSSSTARGSLVVTHAFSEDPVATPSSSAMPRVHSLSSASNASRTNQVCFASAVTIYLSHHHAFSQCISIGG